MLQQTNWRRPVAGARVFHVSPDGPLPSLAAARDAIRALTPVERAAGPITVLVQDGRYQLDEPLCFGPEDSGAPDCPIVYLAAPGAFPRISGGVRLTGWEVGTLDGRPAWTLQLPAVGDDWYFTQLFVNDARAPRTRLPETGYYHLRDAARQGKADRAGFFPGDLRAWDHLSDVELTVLHYWVESHLPIASIDEAAQTVQFTKSSVMSLLDETKRGFARYYVENVREALHAPGQWYLDRATGILTYLPREGETPENTEVYAPRLPQLLRVEGDAAQPVHDLHFVGLTWEHTQWSYPPETSGAIQAAFTVPGALAWRHAQNCSLRLCRVERIANYAAEMEAGCRDIAIIGNTLRDLGAGGVKVQPDSAFTHISDNEITAGGRIFPSAVGVWIGDSGDNTVIHNHIHDLYYTGVSVGWVWGYGPSRAHRNRIEWNHIHNIGQRVLSDMGGVYTLGISPGTSVSYNHIHDVRCYGYGGQGLYPDEGTSAARFEGNISYDHDTGGISMNYGRDVLVRNNILGLSRDFQVKWGSPKSFAAYRFEGNIVYWREGALFLGNWFDGLPQLTFRRNLYWREDGGAVEFSGTDFSGWQARGFDTDGLIADPRFVDPAGRNFTLQPDSPAFKLGFTPLDLSAAGPRPDVLATGDTPLAHPAYGAIPWSRFIFPEATKAARKGAREWAYPDRAPCRVTLQAVIANAGDAPFAGEVRVVMRPAEAVLGSALTAVDVRLAPGEETIIPLEIDVAEGAEEVVVDTCADAEGFWPTSISLGFRPTVTLPALPDTLTLDAVADALHAAPALPVTHGDLALGTVRLGVSGARLALDVDVLDDDPQVLDPVYVGSCIDLFGLPTNPEAPFGQALVVPAEGDRPARALTSSMLPVPEAELAFTRTPHGYRVQLLLPLAALGMTSVEDEFGVRVAIYTHRTSAVGILRAGLFNQRSPADPHAYAIFRVQG